MYEEVRSVIALKWAIKSDPASAFQLHDLFLFSDRKTLGMYQYGISVLAIKDCCIDSDKD